MATITVILESHLVDIKVIQKRGQKFVNQSSVVITVNTNVLTIVVSEENDSMILPACNTALAFIITAERKPFFDFHRSRYDKFAHLRMPVPNNFQLD